MQAHELRAIAVDAHVDPRTVAKILKGETVRGAAGARALAAIARHLARAIDAESLPSEPASHAAQELTPGTEQAIDSQ